MSLKRLLCQSFVSVDLLSLPLYSVLLNAGRGASATDPLGPELIAGLDPAPPPPLVVFFLLIKLGHQRQTHLTRQALPQHQAHICLFKDLRPFETNVDNV